MGAYRIPLIGRGCGERNSLFMRKHRLTVLCVSALGALGVISSGFAGWVITMGPKDASGTGSITADGVVTRQGVESCELEGGNTPKPIRFAATKTPAPGGHGWLTASGNEAVMSATFKFTITTTDANMTVNFADLKFEETDTGKKYDAAKQKGLVGSLPTFVADAATAGKGNGTITLAGATLGENKTTATSIKTTDTSKSLVVTFKVTFAWGTKFGNNNPLDYYNAFSYTSDLDSAANENIKALDGLNGAKFALSFKVSATPKA